MPESNYLEIVKLASLSENTPELQSYWQRRYEDLYSKKLFVLSVKSENIILSQEKIAKPATTYGELVLLSHLGSNHEIDEAQLQNTIETAVRFVDSLLDKINFTDDARQIVQQYRKIGIGVTDFKQYIAQRPSASVLDEIDYLGNLISGTCYRASESLAEEKGVCGSWDKIKTHLRPKSFEYWFNLDNGEIRNGLEMSEDWDEISILKSNFEIVPRRNSHILLYPPDLEWQIWTDRDDTSARAEIPAEHVATIKLNQLPAQQNLNQTQPVLESAPQAVDIAPPSIQEPIHESFEELAPIKENKTSRAQILVESQTKNLDLQNSVKVQQPDAINSNEVVSMDDLPTIASEPISVPVVDISNNTSEESQTNMQPDTNEPQFQIGELVQIHDNTSPLYSKVYQIVDVVSHDDAILFRLSGSPEVEKELWSMHQITAVELLDILDKINVPAVSTTQQNVLVETEIPHKLNSIVSVEAIILNEKGEILVDSSKSSKEFGLVLPSVVLDYNEIPEQSLVSSLQNEYGVQIRIVEEIGSSVSRQHDESPYRVHLGFLVEIGQKIDSERLRFVSAKNVDELAPYIRILLNKLNRKRIAMDHLEKKINSLQISLANAQEQAKKSAFQLQEQDKVIPAVPAESPVYSAQSEQVLPSTSSIASNYTPRSMSKYALKLEQLVQTNTFGDITVTIQYDGQGPRVVTAQSEKITGDLKHTLDTVLVLVNFILTKGVAPEELSISLTRLPEDDVRLPINDLLMVIAASLQQAPQTVQAIDPSILTTIAPRLTGPVS